MKEIAQAIERILPAILRTPTPENSQPWSLLVRDNCLLVYHSAARAKLATFPDDLCVFGAGMLGEAIRLAASTEGLSAEVTFPVARRNDEEPWLCAAFHLSGCAADPLAVALLLRHTDRRRYAGGSLMATVFQTARREAATTVGARLYFANHYPAHYLQEVAAADQATLGWDEMRCDLNRWLRFTQKQINASQDGIPWRALLRTPENWRHRLQSGLWWLEARLDWYPDWLLALEKRLFDESGDLTPKSFADGAGIGCVTTRSAALEDLVAAGRLAFRTWLMLNLHGYSVQPMTNLTSIVYPLRLGKWAAPEELVTATRDGYNSLQRTFGFSNQEIPIFCFRTGLPIAPYPSNARTLRRADQVQWAPAEQTESVADKPAGQQYSPTLALPGEG